MFCREGVVPQDMTWIGAVKHELPVRWNTTLEGSSSILRSSLELTCSVVAEQHAVPLLC